MYFKVLVRLLVVMVTGAILVNIVDLFLHLSWIAWFFIGIIWEQLFAYWIASPALKW